MTSAAQGRVRDVGVGMPQWLKLNLFGSLLRDAFPGTIPYLVGSAAESKQWRDVDVRIMVTPEEYERFCGDGHRQDRSDEPPSYYHQAHEDALTNGHPTGRRRTAITLAFAALGRDLTGLPIDFQFDLYDPDEPMSQT